MEFYSFPFMNQSWTNCYSNTLKLNMMTFTVSQIVLEDLSRAREGFVLASDLHLVYLVTPINVDIEPDWELYYQRFMELSALDQVIYLYLHLY